MPTVTPTNASSISASPVSPSSRYSRPAATSIWNMGSRATSSAMCHAVRGLAESSWLGPSVVRRVAASAALRPVGVGRVMAASTTWAIGAAQAPLRCAVQHRRTSTAPRTVPPCRSQPLRVVPLASGVPLPCHCWPWLAGWQRVRRPTALHRSRWALRCQQPGLAMVWGVLPSPATWPAGGCALTIRCWAHWWTRRWPPTPVWPVPRRPCAKPRPCATWRPQRCRPRWGWPHRLSATRQATAAPARAAIPMPPG